MWDTASPWRNRLLRIVDAYPSSVSFVGTLIAYATAAYAVQIALLRVGDEIVA
jgi:hypothetical protein